MLNLLIKVIVPIAATLVMTPIAVTRIMAPFMKFQIPLLASHARTFIILERIETFK